MIVVSSVVTCRKVERIPLSVRAAFSESLVINQREAHLLVFVADPAPVPKRKAAALTDLVALLPICLGRKVLEYMPQFKIAPEFVEQAALLITQAVYLPHGEPEMIPFER